MTGGSRQAQKEQDETNTSHGLVYVGLGIYAGGGSGRKALTTQMCPRSFGSRSQIRPPLAASTNA